MTAAPGPNLLICQIDPGDGFTVIGDRTVHVEPGSEKWDALCAAIDAVLEDEPDEDND